MSNWLGGGLRGLQNQLTDFTRDVLNETTEEVEDPHAELQVAKSRVSQLEKRLVLAEKEIESVKECGSRAEEKAESAELQLSTVAEQKRRSDEQYQSRVRELQAKLDAMSDWEAADFGEQKLPEDQLSLSPPLSPNEKEFEIRKLSNKVTQLTAENEHWKKLVKEKETTAAAEVAHTSIEQQQTSDKMRCLVVDHEAAVSALQMNHWEELQALKASYEARIAALQVETTSYIEDRLTNASLAGSSRVASVAGGTSQSQSVTGAGWEEEAEEENAVAAADWDSEWRTETLSAVSQEASSSELLRRVETLQQCVDELERERATCWGQHEQEVSRKEEEMLAEIALQKERLEQLDLEHKQSLEIISAAHKQKLLAKDEELSSGQKQVEAMLCENRELAAAYDDLNEQYESHKSEYGSIVDSNRELSCRIDSLKTEVVEYEEKYEEVKSQNGKASEQLHKLTEEIEILKFHLEEDGIKTNILLEKQQRREEILQQQLNSFSAELERLNSINDGLLSEKKELLEQIQEMATSLMQHNEDAEQKRKHTKELAEENERLKSERDRLVSELERLNGEIAKFKGGESTLLVQVKQDQSSPGKKSDDEHSADSNGWDRLADAPPEPTATASVSVSSTTAAVAATPKDEEREQLELEIREALMALTEKTEECELVQKDLREKKQEVTDRDDLLQQAFTELKGLEMQLTEQREVEHELKKQLQTLTVDSARKDERLNTLLAAVEEQSSVQKSAETRDIGQNTEENIAEKLERLEFELENVKNDRDKLEEEVCSATTHRSTLSDAVVGTDELKLMIYTEEELEQLLVAEQQRSSADRTELVDQIATLEETLRSQQFLKSDLAAKSIEFEQISLEKDEALSKLQLLEQQNQEIDSEMNNSRQLLLELEKQHQEEALAQRESVAGSDAKVAELQEQINLEQSARRQLEVEKQQLIELTEKKHQEVLLYYKQAQQLLSNANAEQQQQTALSQRLEQAVAQFESAAAAQSRLEEQLAVAQTSNSGLAASLSETKVRLEQSLAALERAAKERSRADAELQMERSRSGQLVGQFETTEESYGRTMKENERLKAHLLAIEENHTREALVAEEREVELRERLRKYEQAQLVTAETSAAYEEKISVLSGDLAEKVSLFEQTADELEKSRIELEKTKRALNNLQSITSQLQKERDSQLSEELAKIRTERVTLSAEVEEAKTKFCDIRAGFEKAKAENAAHESKIGTLEAEVRERDVDIDQLQSRLDKYEKRDGGVTAASSLTTGEKIDKELLRNLFLGYFAAPPAKRDEVAQLLGSILSFSAEDWSKLNNAASSSWLGFLQRGNQNSAGTAEHSIAAQFVAFLQEESKPNPAVAHPIQPSLIHSSSAASTVHPGGLFATQNRGVDVTRRSVPPAAFQQTDFTTFGERLSANDTSTFLKEALQD